MTMPSKVIQVERLIDANSDSPSSKAVTAVRFHDQSGILMSVSLDKYLKFYRIDGKKNEKQLSVLFPDMQILDAHFIGNSSQVILTGRKPYYYSYDTESGAVQKITTLLQKGLKSHEKVCLSPSGDMTAFSGNGGYIHICNSLQKTWMMDLKMNSGVRSCAFINDWQLVSSGVDAEVYIWDIRYSNRCIERYYMIIQ